MLAGTITVLPLPLPLPLLGLGLCVGITAPLLGHYPDRSSKHGQCSHGHSNDDKPQTFSDHNTLAGTIPLAARVLRRASAPATRSGAAWRRSVRIGRRVPRRAPTEVPGADISETVIGIEHGDVGPHVGDVGAEGTEVGVALDDGAGVEEGERLVEEGLSLLEGRVVERVLGYPNRLASAAESTCQPATFSRVGMRFAGGVGLRIAEHINSVLERREVPECVYGHKIKVARLPLQQQRAVGKERHRPVPRVAAGLDDRDPQPDAELGLERNEVGHPKERSVGR